MSAEMGRLRVRLADLPGFDATGLLLRDAEGDQEGIVVYDDGRDVLVHMEDGDSEPQYWTRDQEGGDEEPYVSTTDASTRDRLARWVAERVGLPPLTTTAPGWRALFSGRGWAMSRPRALFLAVDDPAADRPLFVVPGLADLDADDPRLLPDGSRWVDAVALADVARHLGGDRG